MDIFQKDIITAQEAALLKGMLPATFRFWVWNGRGPKYEKKGGRLYFKKEDVISWVPPRRKTKELYITEKETTNA